MRHVKRMAAAACLALLAAGCSSGGGAGGASTPSAAAQGDVNGLLTGHLSAACAYVPPNVQAKCRSGVAGVTGIRATGTVEIGAQVVQGDEALVALTGKVCLASGNTGSSCMSNAVVSTGMPGGSVSFDSAFSAARSNFDGSDSSQLGPFSPIPCIEINGAWYVDVTS
jgi:hypothetical protein